MQFVYIFLWIFLSIGSSLPPCRVTGTTGTHTGVVYTDSRGDRYCWYLLVGNDDFTWDSTSFDTHVEQRDLCINEFSTPFEMGDLVQIFTSDDQTFVTEYINSQNARFAPTALEKFTYIGGYQTDHSSDGSYHWIRNGNCCEDGVCCSDRTSGTSPVGDGLGCWYYSIDADISFGENHASGSKTFWKVPGVSAIPLSADSGYSNWHVGTGDSGSWCIGLIHLSGEYYWHDYNCATSNIHPTGSAVLCNVLMPLNCPQIYGTGCTKCDDYRCILCDAVNTGLYLFDDDENPACVYPCPEGMYDSLEDVAWESGKWGFCRNCTDYDSNCEVCNTTDCTQCATGYYLDYNLAEGYCVPCTETFGPGCEECTINGCTKCGDVNEIPTFLQRPWPSLENPACVSPCPEGQYRTYDTHGNGLCMICNVPYVVNLGENTDTCECKRGYETADANKPCECNSQNICGKNHFGNHDGIPAARGYSTTSDDENRRILNLENEERVIKHICYGEFWGAYVTTDYRLFMWGENIDNGYIFGDDIPIENAFEIYTGDWDSHYAVKVECTSSAIFVLMHGGEMYFMGRGDDHEVEGGQKVLTFQKSEQSGVMDIHASRHTLYIIKYELTLVTYDGGETYVHKIFSIGSNEHGALAANYSKIHSRGEYVEIDYTFVTDLYNEFETIPDLFMFDHNGDGSMQPVVPRIKAMEYGIWISYKLRTYGGMYKTRRFLDIGTHEYFHFYAGISHPSNNQGTSAYVLTKIDFDNADESELDNADPIDWVDRIFGGCMFILSGEKIYVSGTSECNNGPGMDTDVRYPVPFEIVNYGDFDKDETVYSFSCNSACYILTQDNLYMFGNTYSGIGFEADCADDDCKKPTFAKSDVAFIVPGKGKYIPNDDQFIDPKYDTVWFAKSDPFQFSSNNIVYEHPPSLLPSSGLYNDLFTLQLRKKEVFYQMDPEITFINNTAVRKIPDDACVWPRVGQSNWTVHNAEGYDYFELEMQWRDFRELCAVVGPIHLPKYDHYYTRLAFVENYYRGRYYESDLIKREDFFVDIEVRFPKHILMAEITVQQDEFGEYWDAYIIDKTFDRETRRGTIEFASVTRFPNFFVFADIAERYNRIFDYHHFPVDVREYAETERLGDVFPNNPEYIKTDEDVYFLTEANGETEPWDAPGGKRRSFSCDEKNCYQRWIIHFRVIDDYRVCHIPQTTFPINWVQFCMISEMSDLYYDDDDTVEDHEDCVDPSREVQFTIHLAIDNLCGGELVETIDTTFWMYLYADWTYPEPPLDTDTHIFHVGDWLYFKAGVESTKVSIEKVQIDTITWTDNSHTIQHLYVYDESSDVRMRTDIGQTVKLVIDSMDQANEVGFHFKLHNQLLMLQPDEKKTYALSLYLSVTYMGNKYDVRPNAPDHEERRQISLGNTYMEKEMAVTVENSPMASKTFVYYVVAGVAFGVCVLAVAIIVGISLAVAYVVRRKKKAETLPTTTNTSSPSTFTRGTAHEDLSKLEIGDLKKRIVTLEDEMIKKEAKIMELELDIDEKDSEISELREEIIDRDEEITELSQEILKLKGE